MSKIPSDAFESLEIPPRVADGTEKELAHVVIHADDLVPLPVKVLDGLRTDEAAASGNEDCLRVHVSAPTRG